MRNRAVRRRNCDCVAEREVPLTRISGLASSVGVAAAVFFLLLDMTIRSGRGPARDRRALVPPLRALSARVGRQLPGVALFSTPPDVAMMLRCVVRIA